MKCVWFLGKAIVMLAFTILCVAAVVAEVDRARGLGAQQAGQGGRQPASLPKAFDMTFGQPPVAPPGPGQTSWPQVDFANPASVRAFVEAGRSPTVAWPPPRRDTAYAGWVNPGSAFFVGAVAYVRVNGDRWVGPDGETNPDGKMPDDAGWVWVLRTDTVRVSRMKADTVVRPAAVARVEILEGSNP